MPSTFGAISAPSLSQSNSSKPRLAGMLEQMDANGRIVSLKQVLSGKELIIGRDCNKCQLILDDPCVSAKHLRVYTVVYDSSDSTEVDTLVYAEDLSRNGTYWNGSLIGRGNGGFLLSTDDVLQISGSVSLRFKATNMANPPDSHFDEVQETEMAKFSGNYVVTDRLLGAGAFGKVFMAIEQTTRTQLACKLVDLRKLRPSLRFGRRESAMRADDVNDKDQARRVKQWGDQQKRENKLEVKLKAYYSEAEILASIRHPNIIGLEKVFVTDNNVYMFQDLITGGDLFSYLEAKHGRLSEVEAAVILRQIVLALCFLHEKSIVHRDLKPDNILMTSISTGCRVILTDFGAARRLQPRQRLMSVAGTNEYAAPEVTAGRSNTVGYTKPVDLWSLGCVAVVLLTGASAFADPVTQQYSTVLAKQCNLHSLRQSRGWRAVRARPKDFVERLLVLAEDQRMTAAQAVEHDWFSNDFHKTNFEELYQRAIKHWRPRPVRTDTFEFSDASSARRIARAQGIIPEKHRNVGPRASRTVESHYQPFPRQIHSSFLWPKRKPTASYIAPETRAAMDNWPSSDKDDEKDAPRAGHDATPSKRRRAFSVSSPVRNVLPSPVRRGATTPSRFRKPSRPAQPASLPHTPTRRLVSVNPSTVPLRFANANAKLRPSDQISSATATPSKLRRRSEIKTPSAPANDSREKRRSSVYDFEDARDAKETLTRKRAKCSDEENEGELDLPHHFSAVAEGD